MIKADKQLDRYKQTDLTSCCQQISSFANSVNASDKYFVRAVSFVYIACFRIVCAIKREKG